MLVIGDARAGEHGTAQLVGELPRGETVKRQVGGRVDEALVDRVHVDVLRAHVFEVDAVYARRHLHVVAHAGLGGDVVDVLRDLEDAAAVAHAEFFMVGRV